MILKFNIIKSLLEVSFLDKLWKALISEEAIVAYLIILFILLISFVIIIIKNEIARTSNKKTIKSNKRESESERIITTISEKLNKELDGIRSELNKQRASLELLNESIATPQDINDEDNPNDEDEDSPIEDNQEITDDEVLLDDNLDDEIIPSEDGASRFYMLSQIDKQYEEYKAPKYNNEISLSEFCDEFRSFSCNKLKLYYDISDIRRFIAGLAVTKLIILQGMSGTGKTSLAYAFGEFLNNKTVVVPIQPMWKERTDLIGYYNEFTKKFNETTLLYKMYEANYNKNIYITILDEMNIARVEYYFAEFLSLLELPNPEGRNLDVVSDVWDNDPKLLKEGKLRLPINMWFIGTANNDDSTFAISDKVYDRAMVLNLDKKAEPFEAKETNRCEISVDHLYDLIERAQKEFDISDRNLRRIKKLDEYMIETFHITFGNRIMKQIRAYVPVLVACGGTELEALDDILSRKVLRKLESKNPVYVRAQAEALCNYLDELFGTDKMQLCKETIRNIEQNV